MADKNVFDDEKLTVNVNMTGAAALLKQVKEVQFLFTQDENGSKSELDPVKGEIQAEPEYPKIAKCEFQPPAVDDSLDYYELTYKVKVEPPGKPTRTSPGRETIRVWPKTAKITFTSDDDKAHKKVKFRIVSKKKKDFNYESDENGGWEDDLPMDEKTVDEYEVEVHSPWEIVEKTTPKGRKREYKVSKKPFQALFLSPDPDNPNEKVKQYVNKALVDPWDKDSPHGSQITFSIASKEDHGSQDDTVYIQCEFGRESERDTPKPDLLDENLVGGSKTEEDNGKCVKGQVKLDANKKAMFKVELGCAGGDTCTVKIGATEACGDALLEFQNWRKLKYISVHPKPEDPSKVSDFGSLNGDGNPGFSNNLKSTLEKTMEQAFIELESTRLDWYDATKVNSSNIVAATHVEKTGADKTVAVLTDSQVDTVRNSDGADGQAQADTFSIYWTDFYMDSEKEIPAAYTLSSNQQDNIDVLVGSDIAYAFDPTIEDETVGCVKEIKWKLHEIQDGAAWRAVVDGDLQGGMSALSGLNAWQTVVAADYAKFFKLKNWRKYKITLPTTGATDPGNLLNYNGRRFKIRYSVVFRAHEVFACAAAIRGTVNIASGAGDIDAKTLAASLSHEMGHNMGQGYLDSSGPCNNHARDNADRISGLTVPAVVPDGYIYCEHIAGAGQGVHCAYGLSKYQRGKNPIYSPASANCTMYDCDTPRPNPDFCENCLKLVKAEKLDDVTKDWS